MDPFHRGMALMSANLFRSKRVDLPITQVNSTLAEPISPKSEEKRPVKEAVLSGCGLGVSATSAAPSADEFDPD